MIVALQGNIIQKNPGSLVLDVAGMGYEVLVSLRTKAVSAKDKKVVREVIKDSHMGGFVNFICEQGIVGLAVGLAIGTAAGDTVKKLVTAFIDPLVQLIVGSQQGL